MASRRSAKSSVPAASQSQVVPRPRAAPTTQADKDRMRNEFSERFHQVAALVTEVVDADDKSRKALVNELDDALVSAVSCTRDLIC